MFNIPVCRQLDDNKFDRRSIMLYANQDVITHLKVASH